MKNPFWTTAHFTFLWTLLSTLSGSLSYRGAATFWPYGYYNYNRDTFASSDPIRVVGSQTQARSPFDQATWPRSSPYDSSMSSNLYGTSTRYSPYSYYSGVGTGNGNSNFYGAQFSPAYYAYMSGLGLYYRGSSYPYSEWWRYYSQYPARSSYPSNYYSSNYNSAYMSYYKPYYPSYSSNQGYPNNYYSPYASVQWPYYSSYPSSSTPNSYLPGSMSYSPSSNYPHSFGGYRINDYPMNTYPGGYPSSSGYPGGYPSSSVYPPSNYPSSSGYPPSNYPSPWSPPIPPSTVPEMASIPGYPGGDDFTRRMGWLGTIPPPSAPYLPSNPNPNPFSVNPYMPVSPSQHPYSQSKTIRAVAEVHGPSGVTGTVIFKQIGSQPVSIEGKIMGLSPGPHGMHVLEMPLMGGDCLSAGDHYNPQKTDHGGKHDWTRHIGDLGNIFADSNGVATFDLTDLLISLSGGYSIVNRTLVITEKADDLGRGADIQSKRDGNAGPPVACGVVRHSPV